MTLKTYRDQTIAQALAKVKKDLGKDAVILSTRTVKIGGFLGFFAKSQVEITATDQAPAFARRNPTAAVPSSSPASKSSPTLSPSAASALAAYRQPLPVNTPLPPEAADRASAPVATVESAATHARTTSPSIFNSTLTPGSRTAESNRQSSTPVVQVMPVRNSRLSATTAPFAPVDASAGSAIAKELADIKILVTQVLRTPQPTSSTQSQSVGWMPDALFKQYLKLLEAQVAREIADSIIGSVRDELTQGELTDETIVRTSVLRHLSSLIPVDEHIVRPTPSASGRPRIIALIGPTGVGKTTTTAKLAAAYKLRHGRSVALITSDTYRIAAVDQLRTYAGIIGLPMRIVHSPDEMAAAVRELSAHEIILIDTAGRSQNNLDRLSELAQFLDAAQPDETHLVLSTAACESVLMKTAQAFAPAKPDHILFTKLDEAVNFGVLVNVIQRISRELGPAPWGTNPPGTVGLPVSFVTTGQEVPDHIEPGQSDRLARAVLDNRLSLAGIEQPMGVGA